VSGISPTTRLEPPLNEPLREGDVIVLSRAWASFFIRLADQVADLQARLAAVETIVLPPGP
jgi:hypothetical protein